MIQVKEVQVLGIIRVNFSTLDNTSTPQNPANYSDYTSYAAEVKRNKTYPITIEAANTAWPDNVVKVWIDSESKW
ncbi:hypothetical protein PJW08_09775 [Tenacibaculum finnmarkense]|nr:hypothetical protein PJW08_09775 [Tenacibaculum finnmarkense]